VPLVVRCAGRHFRDMGAPIAILSDFAYPGLCFGAVCLLVTCAAAQLPLFKRLPWEKNLGCAVCCTALLNASVVSWPSLEALYTIWSTWSGMSHFSCDSRVNILNVQAPPGAILACGLTCGYFVQDSLLMVLYPKETTKELGGPTAYKIMWMHHIISIIVWPYAMLNGVGAVFVIQNLSTEITNVGQNLFLLARSEVFGSGAELPIGITWMASFFVFRIIPMPFVVYVWLMTLLTPGCAGLTIGEWVAAVVTVPIPQALNSFWFYKIVRGAIKKMSKGKQAAS